MEAPKETEKSTRKAKTAIAEESELLEALTRILRREETEDSVVKLRQNVNGDSEEFTETVRIRPKLSDVLRAAELLGKHYGSFGERIEGSVALPLIICGEDELK